MACRGTALLFTYLLSAESQPTKAVLAETSLGVFFIRPMSDTILAMRNRRRWSADHSFKNPGLCTSRLRVFRSTYCLPPPPRPPILKFHYRPQSLETNSEATVSIRLKFLGIMV
jgi:hypothetical protein